MCVLCAYMDNDSIDICNQYRWITEQTTDSNAWRGWDREYNNKRAREGRMKTRQQGENENTM